MTKLNWAFVIFMVALCLAAFGANPLLHPDQLPLGTSDEAVRRLESRASSARQGLHPRWMQVIDVQWSGEPDSEATGIVVYRTLFGIVVGRDLLMGFAIRHRMESSMWLAAWAGFLLIEGVAAAHLVRRLVAA